jgi:hypothetical protein
VWDQSEKVEARGRIVQNQGVWGLLFGMQNSWADFYSFEISPHFQQWLLLRFTSGVGWQVIADGSSGAIQPGSAYNTLAISGEQGSLAIRINGTLVLSRPDLYHRTGLVGLSAASFQDQVDIRFDDYVFVAAGCPLPLQNAGDALSGDFISLERPDIEEMLSGSQAP